MTRLRRYPVKSMLGEDVPASDVTGRGLAHDRALALVHTETGKVASAKNPRLWRGLLKLSAAVGSGPGAAADGGPGAGRAGSGIRITLPDGKTVWDDDPGIDAVLSEVLGQPVTLTGTPPPNAELDRAVPEEVLRDGITARVAVETGQLGGGSPAGTFFDFAPIHLFTTATLARIAGLSPRGVAEVERYRPNIVISGAAGGFTENDWAGHDLRVGSELMLRVMSRTPRCAIPALEHGDLPRDSAALRALADHNRVTPVEPLAPQPCAGVYAQVLHPGRIRVGDVVRLAGRESG
ncbi:MAG: MOSC domain-containing protein [Trebonia sp.]